MVGCLEDEDKVSKSRRAQSTERNVQGQSMSLAKDVEVGYTTSDMHLLERQGVL
jgi:hypothetical protein